MPPHVAYHLSIHLPIDGTSKYCQILMILYHICFALYQYCIEFSLAVMLWYCAWCSLHSDAIQSTISSAGCIFCIVDFGRMPVPLEPSMKCYVL